MYRDGCSVLTPFPFTHGGGMGWGRLARPACVYRKLPSESGPHPNPLAGSRQYRSLLAGSRQYRSLPPAYRADGPTHSMPGRGRVCGGASSPARSRWSATAARSGTHKLAAAGGLQDPAAPARGPTCRCTGPAGWPGRRPAAGGGPAPGPGPAAAAGSAPGSSRPGELLAPAPPAAPAARAGHPHAHRRRRSARRREAPTAVGPSSRPFTVSAHGRRISAAFTGSCLPRTPVQPLRRKAPCPPSPTGLFTDRTEKCRAVEPRGRVTVFWVKARKIRNRTAED